MMKKNSMIALTSALAIAAAVAGTGITAGGPAAETAGSASVRDAAARPADEQSGIPFEEAIADLYERSSEISDEEILEIAGNIKPGMGPVREAAGDAAAEDVEKALVRYEDDKCTYILEDHERTAANSGLLHEWDRQEDYTRYCLAPQQTLTDLIPGIAVTACTVNDDSTITVDVDEWMTQTYTEASIENVSAYRYYFTCTLNRDAGGEWKVADVSGTDRNFLWMEETEEDRAQGDPGAALGRSGQSGDEESPYGTASLALFGAASYTYSADAAVAYADKWATSRNPQYRQYPGVDCCNFVSQCLYAGGMPVNDKWYPASYCWINCSGAIANFKEYGNFMKAVDSNVLKGNPVYYDWNSNGVYDHTAICVGKNNSGTPIIDAHTGDHFHATWTLGSNGTRATIQLYANKGSSTSPGTSKAGMWKKIKGYWYYLTEQGTKVTGWLKYHNDWYYLNKNGRMQTGWRKVARDWYYLGTDGKMFRGGWLKYCGKYYYLGQRGKMQTGWLEYKNARYYLGTDGAMKKGLVTVSGKKYYLQKDGKMATGLVKVNDKYYYFGKDGASVTGWKTIKGKKYFFSPSAGGAAANTYWSINGKIYHFGSDGVLIE